VKPAAEDASVGIDGSAVCTTRKALRKRVAQMTEQFEDGDDSGVRTRPRDQRRVRWQDHAALSEIRFDSMPADTWPIVTYAAKWTTGVQTILGTQPVCPAEIAPDLTEALEPTLRGAPGSCWLELMGYGRWTCASPRMDNRTSSRSIPAPTSRASRPGPDGVAFGWSYDELVHQIVDEALTRMQPSRFAADLVSGVPAA
jgi:hypothetical protein